MNCIIEHPGRGVLMEQDWDGEKWVHRFAWSKLRSEACVFATVPQAVEALGKMPELLRNECYVLKEGTWKQVYPKPVNNER